jgi:hypothetical protein
MCWKHFDAKKFALGDAASLEAPALSLIVRHAAQDVSSFLRLQPVRFHLRLPSFDTFVPWHQGV